MSFIKKLLFCLVLLGCVGVARAYAQAGGGMVILRDAETEHDLKTMMTPVFKQAGLVPDNVNIIIVESDEMNSFVAGGQNIFLYTRLILDTSNAAELLGVMAHETGHIADGHLFRGAIDASNLSVEAILADLLGVAVGIAGRSPDAGIAIGAGGNNMVSRLYLRHTRTQEGSADRAGVRFLQGAGLPVTGFLSFMKKLASQELLPETEQSAYLQTHPLTQDRIDALQHAVDTGPPGKIPPGWDEMHARIVAKLRGYLYPNRELAIHDNSIATRYGHAVAWFRNDRPDKALDTLAPLIKAEPQNPFFEELKGQILYENGHIEESIPPYAEAVKLAPWSGLIRIAYAQSLLQSHEDVKARLAEAVRQLDLSLETEKQNPEARHLLAIAYGKQGDIGQSRLQLAEEAVLENNAAFARREAALAKMLLKKGTPSFQRAQDILDLLGHEGKKG
ncbi:MAG: M48 family metalloprotease [Alphaproteobacteria bacterium]|nr:M48 family metalloprotease [Alphaproteobacteria bacterium]MDE2335714.1 M48 family metalloprotease [Alphaproteobacteria bacterium]